MRAQETAAIALREAGWNGVPVTIDERLREKEFGTLDRLTRMGIEQKFPEQAELRRVLGKFYYRPPGGESWTDVILRLRSFVDTLVREHARPARRDRVAPGDRAVLSLPAREAHRRAAARDRPPGRRRELLGDHVPLRPRDGRADAARVQRRRADGRSGRAGDGRPRRARCPRRKPIGAALLRAWPLPVPASGDKNARGSVFVVAGAPQMPGAAMLCATAALRAGAGKLQIGTCASVAAHVGSAVLEALVVALDETPSGAIALSSAKTIAERANKADALVIGPGLVDESRVGRN